MTKDQQIFIESEVCEADCNLQVANRLLDKLCQDYLGTPAEILFEKMGIRSNYVLSSWYRDIQDELFAISKLYTEAQIELDFLCGESTSRTEAFKARAARYNEYCDLTEEDERETEHDKKEILEKLIVVPERSADSARSSAEHWEAGRIEKLIKYLDHSFRPQGEETVQERMERLITGAYIMGYGVATVERNNAVRGVIKELERAGE